MADRQLQIGSLQRRAASTGSERGDSAYATITIVDRQVQVIYSDNCSAVLPAQEVAARLEPITRLLDASANPTAINALWDNRKRLRDCYY